MLVSAGASVERRYVVNEVRLSTLLLKTQLINAILYILYFQLRNLDPFLMLDEFRVSKPAGFPDHPHRGFETVRTYISLYLYVSCI